MRVPEGWNGRVKDAADAAGLSRSGLVLAAVELWLVADGEEDVQPAAKAVDPGLGEVSGPFVADLPAVEVPAVSAERVRVPSMDRPRRRDQCEWCGSSARSEFRLGRWWCRGCGKWFVAGEG